MRGDDMKKITILITIILILLLTGCTDSYTEYKDDCLTQKRSDYCGGYYTGERYCGMIMVEYKTEWYEDCRLEYSGTPQANKEYVLTVVDFENLEAGDELMDCWDKNGTSIERNSSNGNWFYFSIWKTGDLETKTHEYKHYTEEIKYPEFRVEIELPNEFDQCHLWRWNIEKIITKENQTYKEDCGIDTWDYDDIKSYDDFNYEGITDEIIRCLTRT